MKHLITTVGEPKTRGGGGLERWADEEDSQITTLGKGDGGWRGVKDGRRKGREDMKGEEKSHNEPFVPDVLVLGSATFEVLSEVLSP